MPVFPAEIFEQTFSHMGVPVGVGPMAPVQLRINVRAAVVAFRLGNNSIDYTRNRYIQNLNIEQLDEDRIDLRASRFIENAEKLIDKYIHEISARAELPLGSVLCEMTIVRICYTLKVACMCSNCAALFETYSICRLALEQLAWAAFVDGLDDEITVISQQAQKKIGVLNKYHPNAGRIYSYFSNHAHWAYPEHMKSIYSEKGDWFVAKGSSESKAEAMIVVLLLVDLVLQFLVGRQGDHTKFTEFAARQEMNTVEKICQDQALIVARKVAAAVPAQSFDAILCLFSAYQQEA